MQFLQGRAVGAVSRVSARDRRVRERVLSRRKRQRAEARRAVAATVTAGLRSLLAVAGPLRAIATGRA